MSIANYNLRASKQALTFTRPILVESLRAWLKLWEFTGRLRSKDYYRSKNFSKINYFVFAEAQLMLTQELVYLMTGDSLAGMMNVNISGPEEC